MDKPASDTGTTHGGKTGIGTIYYFYKKSPIGWTMLSIWTTYIVLSAVYGFAFELTLPEPVADGGILGFLDDFFPRRGLSYYFFTVLMFGGILYYINKKAIREIFSLNKWMPVLSMGLTAMIVTIQWLPVLMY